MGGRFITQHSFPRSIIETFVADLDAGKFATEIKQLHDYIRLYRAKKSGSEAISRFPYGTDEFFTNSHMMHHIKTHYTKAVVHIVLGNFGTIKRTLATAGIPINPNRLNELNEFEWETWTVNNMTKERIKNYFDDIIEYSKMTKYPKCFEDFVVNLPTNIVEHVYNNAYTMGTPCWEKVITLTEATEIKQATPIRAKSVRRRHRASRRTCRNIKTN